MTLRTFEYRIYPNREQQKLLSKTFGCCRFVYNKSLEYRTSLYHKNKEQISKFKLITLCTSWKKDYPWLNEVSSIALQQAICDMDTAFTRFFRNKSQFPRFKSKKSHRYTFRICSNQCRIEGNKIFIPKLKWVTCKVSRPLNYQIKSVTVKQVPSGKYFVCCLFDDGLTNPKNKEITYETTVGIDLGIKDFIIMSTGQKFKNIHTTKKYEKKLAHLQKELARKVKGSKNREKARIKVARAHEKITNCRKDYLHKISTMLINDNQINTYCLETLNIRGMLKNHRLAKAIADVSLQTFKQLMEYKAAKVGKNILYIGMYEPSTKLCNKCGYKNNTLTLKDREWTCPNCGSKHDRDVNAACNIKDIALQSHNLTCHNTRLGKSVELVELLALVKA